MYLKNGKSVSEPKMIDANHYKVGKEVLCFVGPKERTKQELKIALRSVVFNGLYMTGRAPTILDLAPQSKYLLLPAPIAESKPLPVKINIPKADNEAQPVFSYVTPTSNKTHYTTEPMTYKQKRYLFMLTKKNYNRNELTISQASDLITELKRSN